MARAIRKAICVLLEIDPEGMRSYVSELFKITLVFLRISLLASWLSICSVFFAR